MKNRRWLVCLWIVPIGLVAAIVYSLLAREKPLSYLDRFHPQRRKGGAITLSGTYGATRLNTWIFQGSDADEVEQEISRHETLDGTPRPNVMKGALTVWTVRPGDRIVLIRGEDARRILGEYGYLEPGDRADVCFISFHTNPSPLEIRLASVLEFLHI